MRLIFKIFLFATLLTGTISCGADRLKAKVTSDQSSLTGGQECGCSSSHSPVCGVDGKDYDNSCIATQCFKTTIKNIGHCDCSSNPIKVCGSDGVDHTECEAVGNPNYSIVKFVPCNATEL